MGYNFEQGEVRNSVEEPAAAYKSQGVSQKDKVAYLKRNLHPSTVDYLEGLDFMDNRPFPYDEPEENWFDESDEENPVMPNGVVIHDREVWL